jgi:hypothetical protein
MAQGAVIDMLDTRILVYPYIQKFSNKFSSSGEASDIYNGGYWLSVTKGSVVAALLGALSLSAMIYAVPELVAHGVSSVSLVS